jgi:hypothetical protein
VKPYELFEVLAGKTWRSIERFSRQKIHLGEDAITSNNLDALASIGPSCVFVEDTRSTESTKGCDFELWIGSDALSWKRYAVQAKKIQPSTSKYGQLNHKVGVRGILQIDILDQYAKANRALPIYCFYNYSMNEYLWNCGLPCNVEQLGCSVTPSSTVRATLTERGTKNFTHIHGQKSTYPWRCLTRCPKFITPTGDQVNNWPSPETYTYLTLPPPLRTLRSLGDAPIQFSFRDQPQIFSNETQFLPGWLGIVDVGNQSNDG